MKPRSEAHFVFLSQLTVEGPLLMGNTMCCTPDQLRSVHKRDTIALKCVTPPKRIVRGIITEGEKKLEGEN